MWLGRDYKAAAGKIGNDIEKVELRWWGGYTNVVQKGVRDDAKGAVGKLQQVDKRIQKEKGNEIEAIKVGSCVRMCKQRRCYCSNI